MIYILRKVCVSMSLKKSLLALATACLCMTGAASFAAQPQINAESAYVLDAGSGAELYAKNADQHMNPGGTAMMMTAILGVESGKLDTVMTVGDAAQNLPGDVSRLGLYPGDKVTLRNALTGMMTVGGCDAAMDVAVDVSSSTASFVQAMNDKAAAIGAANTHFSNPTGLPDSNTYSTAKDLAKIAAYGMRSADFRGLVNHTSFDMPYATSGSIHCETTNDFLRSGFAGANGVKTGATNAGGPALVASATRNGHTLIASILNSSSRSADAQALLKYGFDRLASGDVKASAATAPAAPATAKAASTPVRESASAQTVAADAEAYTLRQAPAGQTLTDVKEKQQQAAQLTTQAKTAAATAAAAK